MNLTYRGVQYDSAATTVHCSEGEFIGRYRGVPMHRAAAANSAAPESALRLTYRGMPYIEFR